MAFTYSQLEKPLVSAPMAGGPSSPELVAAVANAGGLGMLGAGYYTVDTLENHVNQVKSLLNTSDLPFGVNLFAPQQKQGQDAAVQLAEYRDALVPLGERYGIDTRTVEISVPNHFDKLVDWLVENPVPVVTFTFGLPPEGVIERLQSVGTSVGITVTTQDAAALALKVGADFLTVQGPEAGGHQSSFTIEESPNETPLLELLKQVQALTDKPLVAGGGVAGSGDVAELLDAGASAVQVGTLFLLADEAGTNDVYRAGLSSGNYDDTRMTRAFTGRPARALVNKFVAELDDLAPAVYPEIHYLTGSVRAAAKKAGNHQHINLWAGTGFKNAQAKRAADIMEDLTKEL